MTKIVSVYAVFADADEAERVARTIVEERLAACANILGPCRSVYRWQGRVEAADEVAAIFKTSQAQLEPLMAAIHLAHSYDVPAIVTLPIATTHREFLAWVLAQTGQG
jgi:periplasmic divalent cation tolerance protein